MTTTVTMTVAMMTMMTAMAITMMTTAAATINYGNSGADADRNIFKPNQILRYCVTREHVCNWSRQTCN